MIVSEQKSIADLLSTSAAGRRLGVSSETVRKLIYAGTLPAEKTQLGYLVDPEAVDALRYEREKARAKAGLSWLGSQA